MCGGRDSNTRTPTRQGPQPCAFDLAGQPPHNGLFFVVVRLSMVKRTLLSNLCKVQLWQHLYYVYIIIEELLYSRKYFFQLSCLLDNGVSALDYQFFYRI